MYSYLTNLVIPKTCFYLSESILCSFPMSLGLFDEQSPLSTIFYIPPSILPIHSSTFLSTPLTSLIHLSQSLPFGHHPSPLVSWYFLGNQKPVKKNIHTFISLLCTYTECTLLVEYDAFISNLNSCLFIGRISQRRWLITGCPLATAHRRSATGAPSLSPTSRHSTVKVCTSQHIFT